MRCSKDVYDDDELTECKCSYNKYITVPGVQLKLGFDCMHLFPGQKFTPWIVLCIFLTTEKSFWLMLKLLSGFNS